MSPSVIEEMKRIIRDSEVTKEDDQNWPAPDRVGKQELEIKIDNDHISFTVHLIFEHILAIKLMFLFSGIKNRFFVECTRKQ